MKFVWIGICLCFLASCGTGVPAPPPKPLSAGGAIYMRQCRSCHQADGTGTLRKNRFAADFTQVGGVLSRSDAELTHSILNGVEGRYGRMPAFKPILTPEEVQEVLGFIRSEFQKQPAAPASVPEAPVPTTP